MLRVEYRRPDEPISYGTAAHYNDGPLTFVEQQMNGGIRRQHLTVKLNEQRNPATTPSNAFGSRDDKDERHGRIGATSRQQPG